MGKQIGRTDSAAMVIHKQTGRTEIETTQRPRLREPDEELSNNNRRLFHTDPVGAESRGSRGQRDQLLRFRDRRWLLRQVHNPLLSSYRGKPARF